MNKKLFSLFLCLLLLVSMVLPVRAEEEPAEIPRMYQSIRSVEEFISLAQRCRLDRNSLGLIVSLETDLDLSGTDFTGFPIFCGAFLGNGHTISGLSVHGTGSSQGLFRYLTATALVKDLHITGSALPQGSRDRVGLLAGENAGTIQNCSVYGIISGADKVGTLVGVNTVTGIIDSCSTEGQVTGNHFIGGIAGENLGVIRNCANYALVNTTPQQNSVALEDITINAIVSSESAATVTDIGGIAGTSGGLIRDCENHGNIGYRQMGYNIGGIAGSQVGYLHSCQNYGSIAGRKDVGGIVGQMEPVTNIQYTTDTLQILQQQLNTMGALAGQVSVTAQNGASAMVGQVGAMQEHVQNAMDALNLLLPGNGLPDADSLQAAQNALSASLSGLRETTSSMITTTQNAAGSLVQSVQALMGQIGAMGSTLNGAAESVGGNVTDISDADTADTLTGKVANCVNYADVLADLNGGGIVGVISPENDLDPEEDITVTGESSMNFDSELRAVVRECENQGAITVKKRNGGGIVGMATMGLVRDCTNTGNLECSAAEYIGGITGFSIGFLRSSQAKCRLSGDAYVGGIAGTANILTDCRSMVLVSGKEKVGAVIGYTDRWEEIAGNYYLTLADDPGAIDGVSYMACAQSLDRSSFRKLEDLSGIFQHLKVTFLFADGSAQYRYILPGESLNPDTIPELPEMVGYHAHWENLDSLDITFDTVCTAVYTPFAGVVASEMLRPDGRPVMLAEGHFTSNIVLNTDTTARKPELQSLQTLVDCLQVHLPEGGKLTVRYLPPADSQVDTLLVQTESGDWQEVPFTVSGSYLVFQAMPGTLRLAAVETAALTWLLISAAAALVLAVAVVLILRRKKK